MNKRNYKVTIKYLAEHTNAANKWLNENAPEHVIKCVEGLTERVVSLGNELIEINAKVEEFLDQQIEEVEDGL